MTTRPVRPGRPSIDDFDWPCSRRDAHHPHPIEDADEQAAYGRLQCEGVGAHPFTTIGGAYGPSRRDDIVGFRGGSPIRRHSDSTST